MNYTLQITDRWAAWRTFLLALPARMEKEGKWIYGGQRNLIKEFEAPDGTPLIVKRYHQPRFLNKFIYSWGIRKPKGDRAYRYAAILQQHGVDTPDPVAYIEHRQWGILLDSYLITLNCPYPHRLYEMGKAQPAVYEPLADALAHFTAHMHNEGILHLDFSPGNILWEQDEQGEYHFSIVDINRMYFGPVTMEQGCKNFARLWGPKAFICRLVKAYARLRHFDEQQALRIALQARRKFWTRYQRHHEIEFPLEF